VSDLFFEKSNPICMTKLNAEKYLLNLPDGKEILACLEVESNILEGRGFIEGKYCDTCDDPDKIVYEFPMGINAFIEVCRIYIHVCGSYVTPVLEIRFALTKSKWDKEE